MLRFGELERTTIVRKYILSVLLILLITTIVSAFLSNFTSTIVSLSYNLFVSLIYIYIWNLVAKYSPDSIMHVYLGGTGLRLITAMFVCLFYCYLVVDRTSRMFFALTFCTYYIIMLVYDTIFFVKHKD